jgi:hypothetical protein
MGEVDQWRASCPSEALLAIDALRTIILGVGPDLSETIKWNAPSFAQRGEDRITLGVERKGGVRVVLHRGARPPAGAFAFEDLDRLAKWPAPDRGVITFADEQAVERRRLQLATLFTRWLEATS